MQGCTQVFDYSEEIIKDNLVRGIADPEIMSDLLGDPKTYRTLDETVTFISQKEPGKVTKSAVGDSASVTSSSPQNPSNPRLSLPKLKCWACGNPSHGQKK